YAPFSRQPAQLRKNRFPQAFPLRSGVAGCACDKQPEFRMIPWMMSVLRGAAVHDKAEDVKMIVNSRMRGLHGICVRCLLCRRRPAALARCGERRISDDEIYRIMTITLRLFHT